MKSRTMLLVVSMLLSSCASHPERVTHANIDGKWLLTLTIPAGSFDFDMRLQQTGQAFTGRLESKALNIDADVAGSIVGNSMQLAYDYSVAGFDMRIDYAGTVQGNKMSGVVIGKGPDGNKLVDGTFKAKR